MTPEQIINTWARLRTATVEQLIAKSASNSKSRTQSVIETALVHNLSLYPVILRLCFEKYLIPYEGGFKRAGMIGKHGNGNEVDTSKYMHK